MLPVAYTVTKLYVKCTRCTIWLFVTVWEYVATTGMYVLPGTFRMFPGGAP